MKTKNSKFGLVATMVALIFTIISLGAYAQTSPSGGGGGSTTTPTLSVPDTLPLGAEYEAYLWDQVAKDGLYGSTSSSINAATNDTQYIYANYVSSAGFVDVDEVFKLVQSQDLTLSVLYPSDTIQLGSSLYKLKLANIVLRQLV